MSARVCVCAAAAVGNVRRAVFRHKVSVLSCKKLVRWDLPVLSLVFRNIFSTMATLILTCSQESQITGNNLRVPDGRLLLQHEQHLSLYKWAEKMF